MTPPPRMRLRPLCHPQQAIDDDCNQTGQMTAALLDWPQVPRGGARGRDLGRMRAAKDCGKEDKGFWERG